MSFRPGQRFVYKAVISYSPERPSSKNREGWLGTIVGRADHRGYAVTFDRNADRNRTSYCYEWNIQILDDNPLHASIRAYIEAEKKELGI